MPLLAHACASHLDTHGADEYPLFNEKLYWGSIGEFLSYLRGSKSPRAKELAEWLSVRRLFKRAIELNYLGNEDLYDAVLKRREKCVEEGDTLFLKSAFK